MGFGVGDLGLGFGGGGFEVLSMGFEVGAKSSVCGLRVSILSAKSWLMVHNLVNGT